MWRIIFVIIVLLTIWPSVLAGAEVDEKLTDLFEVNWESIRYDKSVYRRNPEFTLNDPSVRESLSLSCRVEIKDPNLVLGTCRQGIISEMADLQKQKIDIGQESPRSRNMSYDGLRYRQRFIQQPQLPRWKTVIRSILRTGPTSSRPQLINELQPASLDIQFDIGLLETPGGEIYSLKGYFYALIAESLKYVEVPFEPNDNWIRLTNDLEIRIREAKCSMTSSSRIRYNYNIEENRAGQERSIRLTVEDYLPERIILKRQFVKKDGKTINTYSGSQLPVYVGGNGSGSYSDSSGVSPIEKIRFVIAVNPSHYKIPFEFKNIPLPDPELRQEKKADDR